MHLSSFLAIPFMLSLDKSHIINFTVFCQVGAIIIAFLVMLYLLRSEIKDLFALERKGVGNVVLWSVLGFFLAMIAQFAAILIQTFVLKIQPGSDNTFEIMAMARQVPILIIVITIIGPILEELVFRKAIFGTLYKKMYFFFAGLLSFFIFSFVYCSFDFFFV